MMTRGDLLSLIGASGRHEVEVSGLGRVAIRPLRLSEILAIWDRSDGDAERQLELIAASVVDEAGSALASVEEWDTLLGARPEVGGALGAEVNRAQGFASGAVQGN